MHARSDRPIRRWISWVRPPIRRLRLALAPLGPRPGQHAVLSGDPALPLAAHPAGNPILDGGGTDDPGVAYPDEDRSLGELEGVGHDLDRAQLVDSAPLGATRCGNGGHDTDSTRRALRCGSPGLRRNALPAARTIGRPPLPGPPS